MKGKMNGLNTVAVIVTLSIHTSENKTVMFYMLRVLTDILNYMCMNI